ncbi:MAG: hypothetical protein RL538_517 [Candidatus Parcubacteria bacterium]|jgi:hypothetical protein
MRNTIIFLVCIVILSVFVFVFINSNKAQAPSTPTPQDSLEIATSSTPEITTSTEANPSAENTSIVAPSPVKTFTSEFIAFDYPESVTLYESNTTEVLAALKQSDRSLPLKVYLRTTKESSFESYVNETKAAFEAHVTSSYPDFKNEPGSEYSYEEKVFSYSFEAKTFGGLPVLIHERNFEGMAGDIQEAHVWIGDGKIIKFSSESFQGFESIVASVRKP